MPWTGQAQTLSGSLPAANMPSGLRSFSVCALVLLLVGLAVGQDSSFDGSEVQRRNLATGSGQVNSGADLPKLLVDPSITTAWLMQDMVSEEQHWQGLPSPVQLTREFVVDGSRGRGSGVDGRPNMDLAFLKDKVGATRACVHASCQSELVASALRHMHVKVVHASSALGVGQLHAARFHAYNEGG
jgi:hypothetical protein